MEVSYTSIYTHYWILDMVEKERRMSENSLANLKLGAETRRLGKVRHNFTILPETAQWLKGTGNASDTIDALVDRFKNNGSDSNHTHDKKEDSQLEALQAELAEMRSQLENLEGENNFQESRWKLIDRQNDGLAKQIWAMKENQLKAAELLKEAAKLKKNKKGGYWEKIEEALKLIDV